MFVANWENKADNIRKIKETLDIGFDSMVFVDDNPCERNLVRQLLPGVIVPDLPEDPSDYVRAISELNLFETSSFSAEDLRRVDLYRQEASRRVVQQTYSSIEDYLQSLEMVIDVERFDLFHLPRIAQLIQRSNQFNLTTRRHNQGECVRMMHNERCIPFYAKLKDRFGDHGLISVVVVWHEGDRLMITDWLMSCRVLSRGVEQFLMNTIVEEARRLNLPLIAGQYIPTSKNGMVRDFYARFGFQLTAEDVDGRTTWTVATTEFQPKKVFILRSSTVAAN
jgi:FkbH-like protein